MKNNLFSIKALFVLLILLVSFSCKEEKQPNEEKLRMEKILAAHDEVMPKMGTIGKLIGKLEPMVDTTAIGKQYEVAILDLKEGYNLMMDWMKGFGDRFDSDEIMGNKTLADEKKAWLIEEEEKVNIMRNKIINSIKNAEELLNKTN
ncbi:MAG: hypothetical protein R2785_05175 [Flavobacteriaceae bacterium]